MTYTITIAYVDSKKEHPIRDVVNYEIANGFLKIGFNDNRTLFININKIHAFIVTVNP